MELTNEIIVKINKLLNNLVISEIKITISVINK